MHTFFSGGLLTRLKKRRRVEESQAGHGQTEALVGGEGSHEDASATGKDESNTHNGQDLELQPKKVIVKPAMKGKLAELTSLKPSREEDFERIKDIAETQTRLSQEQRKEGLHRLEHIQYVLRTICKWSWQNEDIVLAAKQQVSILMDKITAWQRKVLSDSEQNRANTLSVYEVSMLKTQKAALEARNLAMEETLAKLELQNKELSSELRNRESANLTLRSKLAKLELRHGEMSSESGSYPGNSATPTYVSDTFRHVSILVRSFSSRLEALMRDQWAKKVETHYRNVTFLRPSHAFGVTLTAEVMCVLFKGFENERFQNGGLSIYPNPAKRQKEFFSLFEDFRHQPREPDKVYTGEPDDQFFKYLVRAYRRVWRSFGLTVSEVTEVRSSSSNSEKQLKELDLAFWKAAQIVWSLHLLSFSFEPPASLFRVTSGSDFDADYMEPPAWLGVEELSITKVAFMISPGLRVGKLSTIRSEIYPIMVTETIATIS